MTETDPRNIREILRDNVQTLLKRAGLPTDSAAKLRDATHIGSDGAAAILEAKEKPDVRIGTVEKIAKKFKVPAWSLFQPDFTISHQGITDAQIKALDEARQIIESLSPAQKDLLIKSPELKKLINAIPYPSGKMAPEWDASTKNGK